MLENQIPDSPQQTHISAMAVKTPTPSDDDESTLPCPQIGTNTATTKDDKTERRRDVSTTASVRKTRRQTAKGPLPAEAVAVTYATEAGTRFTPINATHTRSSTTGSVSGKGSNTNGRTAKLTD